MGEESGVGGEGADVGSEVAQIYAQDKEKFSELFVEISAAIDFDSLRAALLSQENEEKVLNALEDVSRTEGPRELFERMRSVLEAIHEHENTEKILFECYKRLRYSEMLGSINATQLESFKVRALDKGSELAAFADESIKNLRMVDLVQRIDQSLRYWSDDMLYVALEATADDHILELLRRIAKENHSFLAQGSTVDLASKVLDFVTEDFQTDVLKRFTSFQPEEAAALFEEVLLKKVAENPVNGLTSTYAKEYLQTLLVGYLPAIKIPAFEGETEGVKYSLSAIDLTDFRIPKSSVVLAPEAIEENGVLVPCFGLTVENIDCSLNALEWQAEQLYMPYLSDHGFCDAAVSGVKLNIALACGKSKDSKGDWIPEVLLTDCRVDVASFDLVVKDKGSGLSWLYNTLTALFKSRLREYIVALVQDQLFVGLTDFLSSLNNASKDSWSPIVKRFVGCDFDRLQTSAKILAKVMQEKQVREGEYTVRFSEEGPIGIRFAQRGDQIVVKGFSEALADRVTVEERSRIEPGDVLVGYNNMQIASLPLERVVQRMKHSLRPLCLTFKSVRARCVHTQVKSSVPATPPVTVTFNEQKLRLVIVPSQGGHGPAVVKGFSRDPDSGSPGPAEKCGKIKPGMILCGINQEDTSKLNFRDTLKLLKATGRPLTLQFS